MRSIATEKGWMESIIQEARFKRWLVYHTYDSRRSAPGFLDLVLVRGRRLIFAEIKMEGGKLSAEQREWSQALSEVESAVAAAAGTCESVIGAEASVEVYTWYPSDWLQVQRTLR